MINSADPEIKKSQNSTYAVTKNVAVSEWNAVDAIRVAGSGSASATSNSVFYLGGLDSLIVDGKATTANGMRYTYSVFVKNNHAANTCGVYSGLLSSAIMLAPGESRRVTWSVTGDGSAKLQIVFRIQNVGDNFDITFWHPQIQVGATSTDWMPSPEDYYAAIAATQQRDMVVFGNICNTSLFNTSGQVDGELSKVGKVVTLTFNAEIKNALTEYAPYEIATLPSGYIPDTDFYFALYDDYNAFPANWGEVRVSSGSNGKVYIRVGQHNIPANSHISGSVTWILA